MERKYLAAIVGCGGIYKVHAEALLNIPDVCIAAFCDIDKERAEEASRQFTNGDGNIYTDYTEMLEKENLDVVHICTPHYLHVPMAIQAVNKGIAVFCEKPPAISEKQLADLKECVKKQHGKIGFCFQNRYNETVQAVKQICENGKFGNLLCIRGIVTWKRDQDYYNSPWKGKKQYEGGSVLINQAIHTLDLILMFMGKPTKVKSSIHNHHLAGAIECEDTAEAWMEFAGGKRACLYASNGFGADAPVILDVQFETGKVTIIGDKVLTEDQLGVTTIKNADWKGSSAKKYWGDGHQMCISDFYDTIRKEKEFGINLEAVENTMETLFQIYQEN